MKKSKLLISALLSMALSSCANSDNLIMLVGTYTLTSSHGIYSLTFNQETGAAVLKDSASVKNPSFLAITDDATRVYSVSECGEDSRIFAFDFDKSSGAFTKINDVAAGGEDPCHISILPNGKVIAANYSSGSTSVFNINVDGALNDNPCVMQFTCPVGPDSVRQNAPHCHFTMISPDSSSVMVNDLGADRIYKLTLDGESVMDTITTRPGHGPRHSAISPSGETLYVLGELSGDITVYNISTDEEIQNIKADRGNGRGSAHIAISPDGKFLYASHRLDNDGISIFQIAEDGTLSPTGYFNTGLHPRHFNITPNGKFLLVACRDSNKIQVLTRNPSTGSLSEHSEIFLPQPVCIEFGK